MNKKFLILIYSFLFFSNIYSQEINYQHYEGKINGNLNLILDLNIVEQKVNGFYQIDNDERKYLKGTISTDSILQLFEINNSLEKKQTGDFFNGIIYQGFFSGNCKLKGSNEKMKFSASENYSKSVNLEIINFQKEIYVDSVFPSIDVNCSFVLPDSNNFSDINNNLKLNILNTYFGCTNISQIDSSITSYFEIIKEKYSDEYFGSNDWEFNLISTVFYNSNNLLTLNLNVYAYGDQTALKSDFGYLVFDLSNGENIKFEEIISSKSKKELIKLIKEDMDLQGFDKNLVSADNTINVGVDNYGLHFMYDLFQTDDFIVNLVEVSLDFSDVKKILSDVISKKINFVYN